MYAITIDKIQELTGVRLYSTQFEQILKAIATDEKQESKLTGQITIEEIVCNVLKIPYGIAFNNETKSRQRHIMEARHIATYFYYKLFNQDANRLFTLSPDRIGSYINRDRVTVLHSYKTVCDLMETDKWFNNRVQLIRVKIGIELKNNNLKVDVK